MGERGRDTGEGSSHGVRVQSAMGEAGRVAWRRRRRGGRGAAWGPPVCNHSLCSKRRTQRSRKTLGSGRPFVGLATAAQLGEAATWLPVVNQEQPSSPWEPPAGHYSPSPHLPSHPDLPALLGCHPKVPEKVKPALLACLLVSPPLSIPQNGTSSCICFLRCRLRVCGHSSLARQTAVKARSQLHSVSSFRLVRLQSVF